MWKYITGGAVILSGATGLLTFLFGGNVMEKYSQFVAGLLIGFSVGMLILWIVQLIEARSHDINNIRTLSRTARELLNEIASGNLIKIVTRGTSERVYIDDVESRFQKSDVEQLEDVEFVKAFKTSFKGDERLCKYKITIKGLDMRKLGVKKRLL